MSTFSRTDGGDPAARPAREASVVWWLASAAPVTLGLVALLTGFGVPALTEWFWPAPTTNIAEAAALWDGARVRALAARGAQLDAVMPVRRRVVDGGAPETMTPLEAAIRSRSETMVEVILELGARPSDTEAQRLACLAVRIAAPLSAEVLERAFALPPTSCSASVEGP